MATLLRLLPLLLLAPFAAAQAPVQPTGLTALHRDGQTFLTWNASTDPGVLAYQVYRHDQPIDALSLAAATPIQRVTRGSSSFYADRYEQPSIATWSARYLDRFVITDGGAELRPDEEFLVWTIADLDVGAGGSGNGYYAVATIRDDEVENTTDFTAANSIGPVAESIAPPRPVRAKHLPLTGGTVFIQYLDLRRFNATKAAPNPDNFFYGLNPSDPAVAGSLQYAFTYVVFPPKVGPCAAPAADYPAVLYLHGYNGDRVRPYDTFEPKGTWCTAYRIYPIDPTDSWWFGFAEDFDYRTGLVPGAGDRIRNYTERRVLRMVDDLVAVPFPGLPVDPDRVYVVGQSMGGTGTLALALRYPQVFAAAHAGQPMTRPATAGTAGGDMWQPLLERLYGALGDDLPYALDADLPYQDSLAPTPGLSAWDWQDHQTTLGVRDSQDRVPFGIDHGLVDSTIEWQTQGEPTYGLLDQAALCWAGEVTNRGHVTSNQSTLPGSLQKLAGRPFADFTAVRDETVPGFVDSSSNPALPPVAPGAFNEDLEWSPSWDPWDGVPIDTADDWQVSIRSNEAPLTVGVTPRRTQAFEFTTGDTLRWENERISDGSVIQSGTLVVPVDGVPVTPPLDISVTGNRIRFQRTLVADVESVSLAAGGSQVLSLRYGADRAGEFYLVLGSLSGTTPPLPLVDGTSLPLAIADPYFSLLLASPNPSFLTPNFATLDADGKATCTFNLPPGTAPSLAGTILHHAAGVISLIGPQLILGGNPIALELLP